MGLSRDAGPRGRDLFRGGQGAGAGAPLTARKAQASPPWLAAAFVTRLKSARYEQVWVAYFDHARSILSFERLSSGGRHGAALDPRGVVRRALALNARRIVLVHNHPSGPSTPSWPDVLSTGVVDAACNLFEIALDDHLIVSRHGIASMRRLGMIRAQTVDEMRLGVASRRRKRARGY